MATVPGNTGIRRVNGAVDLGEAMTGDQDFFILRTTLDITPTGDITTSSQARLDRLVEVISTRAQPIIMGMYKTVENAPVPDLPVTGSAPYVSGDPVTVYNFKFSIEHAQAWDNVDVSLLDALNGVSDFVYTIPSDANNVSLQKSSYMDL